MCCVLEHIAVPNIHNKLLSSQIFFRCMPLHIVDRNKRERVWRAWSEGRQRGLILHVLKLSSDCRSEKLETLIIEKTDDTIPHTTRMRSGMLAKGEIEGYNIDIAMDLCQKRAPLKHVYLSRSTKTKKASTTKHWKQGRCEWGDHIEANDMFDD